MAICIPLVVHELAVLSIHFITIFKKVVCEPITFGNCCSKANSSLVFIRGGRVVLWLKHKDQDVSLLFWVL